MSTPQPPRGREKKVSFWVRSDLEILEPAPQEKLVPKPCLSSAPATRDLQQVEKELAILCLRNLLSPKKCSFLKKEFNFLEHVVSVIGVASDPSKINSVHDWELHEAGLQFPGTSIVFVDTIPLFTSVASLLTWQTHKDAPFDWTSDCI